MRNHLKGQTSPYLLQHAENPVDWYPWGEEAFARARAEDKPVFLSIGYSTCHWCHVMAHESFENEKTAELLNRHFISIKVDKEERPDIDSIYMAVCQAFTGGGGWPTSIFMSPDQKPFFAGTYFPPAARYGMIGFPQLLEAIHDKWEHDRQALLRSGDEVIRALTPGPAGDSPAEVEEALIGTAVEAYRSSFDKDCGGFGSAPKFPTPHALLFLLTQYEKHEQTHCLAMAETTLLQMYRGGLFDHMGFGFCRYSTDRYFLAPHFEKMLYDNALLILAYCKAFSVTGKPLYRAVAEKTAAYILREMTVPGGGFASAQDADSNGEEGKYYLLEPWETVAILGESTGEAFNRHYDITPEGNFEGKSIPNLLKSDPFGQKFEACLPKIYAYRRERFRLHLDDKILTSWNALMIAAMCRLYRTTGGAQYLESAQKARRFMENQLCDGDTLFVSFRDGKRGARGFLDEYANAVFAYLELYGATLEEACLERALRLCQKALADFYDGENGGFYLNGKDNEALILRPKETYDGALPSGNSVMAHNLVRLYSLTGDESIGKLAKRQLDFMYAEAKRYPAGHAMFLMALSDFMQPPMKITVARKEEKDLCDLPLRVSPDAILRVLRRPTPEYPLMNNKTTYYVCRDRTCAPPANELAADIGPRVEK